MNKPMIHNTNFAQVQDFPVTNDEIDLKELFHALWQGKWTVIATTILFAIAGVLFALSKPNIYQANTTLVAASEEKASGLAAMASRFGGLASLAGINIGGGETDGKALALETLKSRKFINAFIEKYQLLPALMAVKSWDKDDNKLIYDAELYDGKQWLDDPEKPGETLKPSAWDAYEEFQEALSIKEEKDTGMITIGITHFSPYIAQQWTELIIKEINLWMKQQSLLETNRNIEYLKQQLDKTKIVDMQSVFYQLIEDQTKTLMLAEVKDEFAFKTIDPAVVPEKKTGPKRALICVLATLLGGMLGVAIVLVRFAFRKN